MVKERNYFIDVIKCLACFMVVLLHYPCEAFGNMFKYIQTMTGRIGFPIFFMISGYLIGKKYNNKHKKRENYFLKQAIKMISYFLVFSVLLYIAFTIFDLLFNKETSTINIIFSKEKVMNLLIWNQPFFGGHYWYLLAYAYCLIIYWFASFSKRGYNIILCISPILLFFYFILGRYSRIFFANEIPFYMASNFIFAAIPMFTIGFWMPKFNIKKLTNSNIGILIIFSSFMLFGECIAFKSNSKFDSARNDFIFNIVIAFLIIYYVSHKPEIQVNSNNILAAIGKKYSLYIYVFQSISYSYIFTFINHIKRYSFGKIIYNFAIIVKPIIVFLGALIISVIFDYIVKLSKLIITGYCCNRRKRKVQRKSNKNFSINPRKTTVQ